MAKYTVTHTCGHDQTHKLFGPSKDREKKIEWLETTDCRECWLQSRQQSADEKTESLQLPEIVGTEKQVPWAMRERLATGSRFHEAIIEASNQDGTIRDLLRDVYPGASTLMACDRLDEIFPGDAELIKRIRQSAEWFSTCKSARVWIDSRDYDSLEEILGYVEKQAVSQS